MTLQVDLLFAHLEADIQEALSHTEEHGANHTVDNPVRAMLAITLCDEITLSYIIVRRFYILTIFILLACWLHVHLHVLVAFLFS